MKPNEIDAFLQERRAGLVQIRRTLHQNPELSNKEFKTAEFISNLLMSEDIKNVRTDETSVVVTFGPNSGSAIAFRADIDALPITEQNTHEFISRTPGIMHACGHDVHTTILLGLSFFLHHIEPTLKKPIKLIFQQAEESNPSGAYSLVKKGVLKNPDVEQIYGFHVWPNFKIGEVGTKHGNFMGGLDGVKVTIESKDQPDDTGSLGGVDGIRIVADFLSQVEYLMHGRRLTDNQPYTLSFGRINGGVRPNIFVQTVKLEGVIRYLNKEAREIIINKIRDIISVVHKKYSSEIILDIAPDIRPILLNSEFCVEKIQKSVATLSNIEFIAINNPLHVSEDFGWYLQNTPGAYILLGCKLDTDSNNVLHSPLFDLDERVIDIGILLLSTILLSDGAM
ncbi:MAG: M20 metallopeptidase family protein [Candidatus Helarchaeota archaeon]